MSNAIQFDGPNFEEIEKFCGGDAEMRGGYMVVATLQGALRVKPGQWIVKNVDGSFATQNKQPHK